MTVTTDQTTETETAYGRLLGRIVDVDSHEMIPTHLWPTPEYFGDAAEPIRGIEEERSRAGFGNPHVTDISVDDSEITEENMWSMKGVGAPAAFDLHRRADAIDVMGIQRQLIFPSFGFSALLMSISDREGVNTVFKFNDREFDSVAVSEKAMAAHNEWAMRATQINPERLRPVGVLNGSSPEDLVAKAEHLVDGGIRAVWLPAAVPPGGVSPADRRLDAFWSKLEAGNVAIVLHLGTQSMFQRERAWGQAPEFSSVEQSSSIEFSFDSYTASTLHWQMENFLTTMVYGGVLERFPRLRIGIIESGCQWLGPLADRLDLWAGPLRDRLGQILTMKPSEYIARNVRITPFIFEPVQEYIAAYPNLENCFCYSSDFPHVEGGRDSARAFYERVAPLGERIVEKFFVENGTWLLPA